MSKRTTYRPEILDANVWIFDLDNTLYPAQCNLFHQVDIRMGDYISRTLDLPYEEARRIQKQYYREHGTTLNGLMLNHKIDPKSFLDYVHDIDYTPVEHSAALVEAVEALPGRRLIFTNGTVSHAEAVLDRLGLSHAFERIFDIVASDYIPKPNPEPYDVLLAQENIDPRRAVMVEDIAKNLEHPARVGMQTVWIDEGHAWVTEEQSDADHIHHITDHLPDWLTTYHGHRQSRAGIDSR